MLQIWKRKFCKFNSCNIKNNGKEKEEQKSDVHKTETHKPNTPNLEERHLQKFNS
jgi:hypothetical protein